MSIERIVRPDPQIVEPVASPPRIEPVVLEGRFVRLEPLDRKRHAADLAAAALSDPSIWEYMPMRVVSPADFERWMDAALASRADGLSLPFAVVDRATGKAIGSTRLFDYRPNDRGVEIGHTWYAPWAQGTGVNPECKLLLMRHAFQALRCLRVQIKTDERNVHSRGAIAKLGARQEGILRKHMVQHGGTYVRNTVYFSVLDDEWPAVEQGLLARLSTASPPRSAG